MPDKKTLKSEFSAADNARLNILKRARICARLTHPDMLPELNVTADMKLKSSFQSLGSDGLSNVTSKITTSIFHPPWFRFKPSAKVIVAVNNGNLGRDVFDEFGKKLHDRELQIQSQFEKTKLNTKFRTTFEHTLGVGNSLTLSGGENGDYWYKNFRLDHFVQKRANDGTILWGITMEMKDPMELSDRDISEAGLGSREELEKKEGEDRNQELYTKWIRQSDGRWLIQQEMNEKIIRWSLEKVNPYFALGYIEMTGEDWSRGFVEGLLGDLLAFDTHMRSLLDWGVNASKITPVIDDAESGGMTPEDLGKVSGEVIYGMVRDGNVRGVAFLATKMQGEIRVVAEIAANLEDRLSKQFLLEIQGQRDAERVTATEIIRDARQLEGALGAIYSEVASEIQRPLLDRMMYQMERDRLLEPLPEGFDDAVDIEILTGLSALGRQKELEKLGSAVQMLSVFPEAMAELSTPRIAATVFQAHDLDIQKYSKTKEEKLAAAEAAEAQQLRLLAAEQAIKTGGAVIEEGAKQQAAAAAAQPAA